MNLVTIEHLTKSYTERRLFDDAAFSLNEGEKVGLLGINGTGKSTLLKILAGREEPDEGSVVCRRNLYIRYLPQIPEFKEEDTVLESIMRDNEKETHYSSREELQAEVRSILNELGIREHDARMGTLSGGQRKRVALASVLLSRAELLLMDEPTNHLDGDMSDWLEEYLHRFKGTLLLITHDRYFLDSVVNRIVELDQGKFYSYQGGYQSFLALKAERLDMAEATDRKRQSILRMELQWMQRGARARSTKQKARIQRYGELQEQKGPEYDRNVALESIASRLGRTTVEVTNLCKAYGDRILIQDFSYLFLKNDRVGIIGPNGSGKSTLMKILAGMVQPDAGSVEIGQTVKIGYFAQENEAMDENRKVIDYIKDAAEYIQTKDGSISAGQMLERFLFPAAMQYTAISRLSGGEKRRLYLLRILAEAPNVLLLDEPANYLDIQTLTILEDYLDSFPGIVVAVSHDRYFLDRVVNRLFVFEGQGKITRYEGGYTDFRNRRKEQERAAESVSAFEGGGRSENGRSPAGEGNRQGAGAGRGTGGSAESRQGAHMGSDKGGAEERSRSDWKKHAPKLKFTYQEQKDYAVIEGEIADLEAKIAGLEQAALLAATDFVKLNQLTVEKEEAEQLLETKMDRWLYLEDLKARIEAGE